MIKITDEKLLSDNWYVLKKFTYDYPRRDGSLESQTREVYDRGDGGTVLLTNSQEKKVILTRQFRLPTFLNGNPNGLLIETCAGLLDGDSPEACVRKEAEEETGYRIHDVKKVFELYMSPGAVTENIHFFTAQYDQTSKISAGGGLASETEDIEVLEFTFEEIKKMMRSGEIRDGKTMILLQHALLEKIIL